MPSLIQKVTKKKKNLNRKAAVTESLAIHGSAKADGKAITCLSKQSPDSRMTFTIISFALFLALIGSFKTNEPFNDGTSKAQGSAW